MKNKTKTYVLLVVTLCVWGLIGYKIISALNPDTPQPRTQEMMVNFKPQTTTEKDTFTIQTVSRDPFLWTTHRKNTAVSTSVRLNTQRTEWPQLSYGGLVRKENTNDKVFVVNINTKQYLLKKGQTIDEVTLIRGDSKEIEISYKNHQKTIAIQQ